MQEQEQNENEKENSEWARIFWPSSSEPRTVQALVSAGRRRSQAPVACHTSHDARVKDQGDRRQQSELEIASRASVCWQLEMALGRSIRADNRELIVVGQGDRVGPGKISHTRRRASFTI